MQIGATHYRSIWLADDAWRVQIIDQRRLPHELLIRRLETLDDAVQAIRDMQVRGAPLIGATAAYGLCLAVRQDPSECSLTEAAQALKAARPTAVNLSWAVDNLASKIAELPCSGRCSAAYALSAELCDADVATNRAIGEHGLALLRKQVSPSGDSKPINVLTHCNAGWLATVDWGTALAPIFMAHDAGLAIHVWVDETRPRNQGASLTAWELQQQGIPHTLIVDNAGGHLMQHGLVDLCITGADRVTRCGDACNKIGTYLKALAAHDNGVPFFVALPSSTIDWGIRDGIREIPIEKRPDDEVTWIQGVDARDRARRIRVSPKNTRVRNDAFDVTPARLVSGLITERGVCAASESGLGRLFPEKRSGAVA